MAMSPLGAALSFQQPMVPPARQPIGNTDVVGAYRDAQNQAMMAYQAQLGQQNAMWGGLAGLGGAGILAAPKMYQLLHPAATAGSSFAAPGADAVAQEAAGQGAFDSITPYLPGAGGDLASAAGGTGVADALATAAPAAGADAAAGLSLADILPFLAFA